MSTIVNGNGSVNRLIETLAGSAVLLSDPAGATSVLPAAIGPLQGDAPTDGSANASASANPEGSNASLDLAPLAASGSADTGVSGIAGSVVPSLGGDLLGGLPVVGDLTGTSGGLPIVGDLLGSEGLPIVGNVLGSGGLPIVGDVLGGGGLPVVGDVLGGGGLPVVGDVLGGGGLPVVGDVLGGGGLPIVGDLLGNGGLPIVGNLGGLGDLPVIGDLLGGNGLPPLTIAGEGATLQPVLDVANVAVIEVHAILENLAHQIGLPDLVHAVTDLGETIGLGHLGEGHNLLTDVVNLPSSVLDGTVNQSIADIGNDLSNTVHSVANLVNNTIGSDDPTNPLPEIIAGVGHTLQSLPLLTINGGNSSNGGLLGGIVGDLSHSSSGHLIDVGVGPQQQSGGLPINILAANDSSPQHTVDVHVVDVGANGPHLADLGVLTGGNLLDIPSIIPSLGGAGADSLVGNLLGGATGGAAASSPIAAVTQLADVHDVLPIASVLDHGPLNLQGLHLL